MRALADLEVLIIDCQTTGASPAFGSVLELGWGVVRADRPELQGAQAHWIQLPDGHQVPRQVQKITGYEPAYSALALPPNEAWQRLRRAVDFAPAAPSAIHYARFELAFLRDWAARWEPGAPFPLDTVCVHAIALRLYPDLPRQSLRALAGYLGHSLNLTRRSLGHVEATAFVWRRLCAELGTRGIDSWEELQALLANRAVSKPRPKKPKYPIVSERYRSLPDQPGVYRFVRSNGDVLYVGKASSLKKRTASHFSARSGSALAPEMLTQVSDVQVSVTASSLEAALLENELIKSLRPPYNQQLTASDPRVWYSNRGFDSATPTPDEEHRIGPLPSAYSLRPLAALSALLAGEPASAKLRADVVGVSDLWTPDAVVFAAGWAELVARHPVELGFDGSSARSRALRLAKKLLLGSALGKSEGETATLDAAATKSDGWDPERVARHVERAAAQAYQSFRRARWLQLLQNSDVTYREPDTDQVRLLTVRGGDVLEIGPAGGAQRPREMALNPSQADVLAAVPGRESPSSAFDRAKYDRLRILSTELKRIARDGGDVSLGRGANRHIPRPLMAGLLRLI